MFDIGWSEMALIAVVAVVVIGPKELPKVMREVGQWVAKARAMSRTFMDQLEEMSRETGLDEVRKDVQSIGQINPQQQLKKVIDPEGVIDRQMEDLSKIGAPFEPPLPTSATAPSDTPPEAAATDYIPPSEGVEPDSEQTSGAKADEPAETEPKPATSLHGGAGTPRDGAPKDGAS